MRATRSGARKVICLRNTRAEATVGKQHKRDMKKPYNQWLDVRGCVVEMTINRRITSGVVKTGGKDTRDHTPEI